MRNMCQGELFTVASSKTKGQLFFAAIFRLFIPCHSLTNSEVVTPRHELKTDKALCFPRMPDSDLQQLSAAAATTQSQDAKRETKADGVGRNEMLTKTGRGS